MPFAHTKCVGKAMAYRSVWIHQNNRPFHISVELLVSMEDECQKYPTSFIGQAIALPNN